MVIQDIYDQLFFGELRQIYLNSIGEIEIEDCHKREVAVLIQGVLNEIYSEVLLALGRVEVEIQPDVLTYSISDDSDYLTHIRGSKVSEMIKIIKILDPQGQECIEGIWNHKNSFIISNYRTVTLPKEYIPKKFLVDYQATHPRLDINKCITSPESVWIDLPNSYMNIICLGVAARKLSITGFPDSKQRGIIHLQAYQQALREMILKNKGIPTPDIDTNIIRDGGYV